MKKRIISILLILAFFAVSCILGSVFVFSQSRNDSCYANFHYSTYKVTDGVYSYSGTFYLECDGKEILDVDASAGYMDNANDFFSYNEKNKGPLPPGGWYIIGYKDSSKNRLVLEPDQGTETYDRYGFQIHKRGNIKNVRRKTSAESSTGCIVLEDSDYWTLSKYFDKYGKTYLGVVASFWY